MLHNFLKMCSIQKFQATVIYRELVSLINIEMIVSYIQIILLRIEVWIPWHSEYSTVAWKKMQDFINELNFIWPTMCFPGSKALKLRPKLLLMRKNPLQRYNFETEVLPNCFPCFLFRQFCFTSWKNRTMSTAMKRLNAHSVSCVCGMLYLKVANLLNNKLMNLKSSVISENMREHPYQFSYHR